MNMPEILKSKSILIHLIAWVVGVTCLGLLALGVEVMIIGCAVAGMIAFFSGVVALPVALVDLFQSREKSLGFRLQLGAVAIMATIVLACGLAFQILTAGRH
jgi:hypothetical protein